MRNKKSVLICCSLFFVSSYCLSMSFSRFSLKQAINVPALKMVTSIIRKPALAIPQQEITLLSDLNVRMLKGAGIKYIVFDKDNTLCHTYSDELHPSVVNKVNECKQEFSPSSVAILSNSVGTKDDTNYAGAVATELAMSIPVIRHDQKKPGCLHEVDMPTNLVDNT
jgi:phosphatidylglycerophosphatase GEP4